MGEFGMPLPSDAQQVRVVKPPLENFRAKAVISFTASRDEVFSQTCQGVKDQNADDWLILPPIDKKMLQDAGITYNRNDYGYCHQYEDGRNSTVLVPRSARGTTYVVLYHMPFR